MLHNLRQHVFLVRGAVRGAIIDVDRGRVYSLNASAVKVLERRQHHPAFWAHLEDLGLATPTANATPLPQLPTRPPCSLRFVWFEVTNLCNLRCCHCYANAQKQSPGRRGNLPYRIWSRLIHESRRLGATRCQFIGGEPLLFKDPPYGILDLLRIARDLDFEGIELFTNATHLDGAIAKELRALGVSVAVSFYAATPDIHDAITGRPGSQAESLRALELLQQEGVSTRIAVVVVNQSASVVEETLTFLKQKAFQVVRADLVRPSGRGCDCSLSPEDPRLKQYGMLTEPAFPVTREVTVQGSG